MTKLVVYNDKKKKNSLRHEVWSPVAKTCKGVDESEEQMYSQPAPPSSAPLTLSVFFEGTHNEIEPVTTQVGWFFDATVGVDITNKDVQADPSTSTDFKMGFDGCGVVCGLLGTVFAFGLGSQCSAVVQRVHELLQSGRPLRLNCFGLSRGGCACLMLARRLSDVSPERLLISLLLFDPVPGNSVTVTRYLDVFGDRP